MTELSPVEQYSSPIGTPEDFTTEYWMTRTEDDRIYRFLFSMNSDCIHAIVEATLLTDKSMGVINRAIVEECTTDETLALIHEAMPELDITAIVDERIHGWAVHEGWSAQEVLQRTTFLGTESKWQEALERYRFEQENPSTGWTVCDCV